MKDRSLGNYFLGKGQFWIVAAIYDGLEIKLTISLMGRLIVTPAFVGAVFTEEILRYISFFIPRQMKAAFYLLYRILRLLFASCCSLGIPILLVKFLHVWNKLLHSTLFFPRPASRFELCLIAVPHAGLILFQQTLSNIEVTEAVDLFGRCVRQKDGEYIVFKFSLILLQSFTCNWLCCCCCCLGLDGSQPRPHYYLAAI